MSNKEVPEEVNNSFIVPEICGAIILTVSLVVIYGWLAHVEVLLSVRKGWTTLKFNTAVCFALTGAATILVSRQNISTFFKKIIYILTSFLFIISSLTLAEHLFDVNLLIDEIFLVDYVPENFRASGRMALITSVCLLLISVTIAGVTSEIIKKGQDQYILMVPFFMGIFSLLTYLFQTQYLMLQTFSKVSVITGFLLVTTAAGLIFRDQKNGFVKIALSRSASGMFLRNVFLFNIVTFPLIAYLRYIGELQGFFDSAFGISILVMLELFLVSMIVIYQANRSYQLEIRIKEVSGLLMKANKDLSKINLELDNFVYTASHDLKAPVNNLEGLMANLHDELKDEIPARKDLSEILDLMQNSISRFKITLSDLSVTAAGKGGGYTTFAVNSFAELTSEVKLNFKKQLEEKRAVFKENYAVSHIRFSTKDLRSILHNLISNAVKYNCPERRLQVVINTYSEGDYVVLSVGDNGIGMKEADKDKIFQMFQRAHSHVEGVGVGLGIVSRIVENSGGKIEVESELNRGTVFKVYLKSPEA
jgi:signal transduction histidine kinase